MSTSKNAAKIILTENLLRKLIDGHLRVVTELYEESVALARNDENLETSLITMLEKIEKFKKHTKKTFYSETNIKSKTITQLQKKISDYYFSSGEFISESMKISESMNIGEITSNGKDAIKRHFDNIKILVKKLYNDQVDIVERNDEPSIQPKKNSFISTIYNKVKNIFSFLGK